MSKKSKKRSKCDDDGISKKLKLETGKGDKSLDDEFVLPDVDDIDINEISQVVEVSNDPGTSSQSEVLDWKIDDLQTLINNIAKLLPKSDNAKYSTAAEKIDWEKVKFDAYTGQQCKDKWIVIMSRLRRYRTLTDMVGDARNWVKQPWCSYNNGKKMKHPDFPKKPLTPFFKYFMEKRVKASESSPTSSVTDLAKILSAKFAALSTRKKQKYKDAYYNEYNDYKLKLEEFKHNHPELDFGNGFSKESMGVGKNQTGLMKPKTPYQLFYESRMKAEEEENGNINKKEAADRIKAKWASLSDGKRIKYIRKALADEQRYEKDAAEYRETFPDRDLPKIKSVLNKAEQAIKDRFYGKPEKPPNSGYSLFSQNMLRGEMKDIPSKEKMTQIAAHWKSLSDAQKQEYNLESQLIASKYIEKFTQYLEKLPEHEKVKAVSENKVKFPSGKKLKNLQLHLEEGKANKKEMTVEELNADPTINGSALIFYRFDRLDEVKEKHPDKSDDNISKIIYTEWNKLPAKKKAKWLKQASSVSFPKNPTKPDATQTKPEVKAVEKKPVISASILAKVPKKPAKSGYALFTGEKLPLLTNLDPKKRMNEVSKLWSEIGIEEKKKYEMRNKELNAKYQREHTQFLSSLSPDELHQYQEFQSGRMIAPRNKPTSKSSPVKKAKDTQVSEVSKTTAQESDNDSDGENRSESESEPAADEIKTETRESSNESGSASSSESDSESDKETEEQPAAKDSASEDSEESENSSESSDNDDDSDDE